MIGLAEPALERLAAERLLATSQKGRGEIRISLSESGAVIFRLWERVAGDLVPTKIGFAISLENFSELVAAIEVANSRIEGGP